MADIWVREDYVIQYEGPGWYGDMGRWDSNGRSYVEGVQIATFDEYDQSGFQIGYPEYASRSPYVWDIRNGRGTPYKLLAEPTPETM